MSRKFFDRKPVMETNFPNLNLISRGKVRDIYDLDETLLIVATDRISAFDVVMPTPISGKGVMLTQISEFWLNGLDEIIKNHLISANVEDFPRNCRPYVRQLKGRSMLVKKAEVLPVECIVRGYLVGSGWKDYQKTGEVCGIKLPNGLQEAQKLPKPIFTPSTKAEQGLHDENIPFGKLKKIVGRKMAMKLRRISLKLYETAAEYALRHDVIIADTKFEFGIDIKTGNLMLIDEVLTPDSSRFWPKEQYRVGSNPPSFDKQYMRNWLESNGWDKKSPAPVLPGTVVRNTQTKYFEALNRLTGKGLSALT